MTSAARAALSVSLVTSSAGSSVETDSTVSKLNAPAGSTMVKSMVRVSKSASVFFISTLLYKIFFWYKYPWDYHTAILLTQYEYAHFSAF